MGREKFLAASHLTQEIHTVLFSDEPNVGRLHCLLQETLGFSCDATRLLIYQVALRLNASLFPPVTQLELIHTEGCNLACSYCFEKAMLGWRKMAPETALAAVDLLFDYSGDEPDLNIVHFGGEPTLNFPAIQRVTEYAEEKAARLAKDIRFDLTSNGVVISDEMAEYFARHGIKVLLSIDGLEVTHNRFRVDKQGRGTFERAMKGFRILKRVQPWVGVKMTVMPENVPHLCDDVRGLYDLGVNQFIIGHATGLRWSREHMDAYGEQLAELYRWYKQTTRDDLRIAEFDEAQSEQGESFFGCQAGTVSITVAINGEVSPCSKILALNNRQLLSKLGDVHYGLTHLLNRRELVDCSRVRSACDALGIAREYHGGCFASNYDENHDLFAPSAQEHRLSLLMRSACSTCGSCKS